MDIWDLYSDEDEEIINFISRPFIVREVNTRTNLFDTLQCQKVSKISYPQRKFNSNKNNAVSAVTPIESKYYPH